ncbi:MAG: transglycosylase SLT domain-containing protein [bacterium]|nr:transglycosylase SLT domain-containing protein [bacterium]
MRRAAVVALLVPLLVAVPARAREVAFTLQIDAPLLEAALRREVGLGRGPTVLWGAADGCRFLLLHDLRLVPADAALRLTAHGTGQVGLDLAAFCFLPFTWEGTMVATGAPRVDADWQLRLGDLHTELLDHEGRSTFVGRRLWGFAQGDVEDALARFRFDLGPPIAETRALIRASAPADRAAPVLAALDTLRPRGVRVEAEGVAVQVALDVEDAAPAPPSPEPALSPEERARWEEALDRWDAFLVFVVKDLGGLDDTPALRDALFDLLMRSRHELVGVLAVGPLPGADPVRGLFLDAWNRLRPIVREAALAGRLEAHALRYLAFLTAGDALAALDAAAPGLGLEISADGLRRLARILEPDVRGDPLTLGDAPDPALRKLFGFVEPESSPPGVGEPPPEGELPPDDTVTPPTDATTTTVPEATDTPAAGAATTTTAGGDGATTTLAETPAPTTTSTAAPVSTTLPPTTTTTLPPDVSWWPFGAAAWAAAMPSPAALPDIARTLDRWVPEPLDQPRYRDLVSQLLDLTARDAGERGGVDSAHRTLFRHIVRTTAWQESCWRQFWRRGGRVTFVRSETDDVGIMQVNRRVWRGFFDVRKLEWDIVYNASAGAEILAQLLTRYGVREMDATDRHPARAVYSAYNGGPAAYTRYRRAKVRDRDRKVDGAFWRKFQETAAGRELEQVLCEPLSGS